MALRSVLILTYHFPPSAASGSFRALGFARHLPDHGWRAVVVAPPSLPWEPVDPDLSALVTPETTVYPVPYMTSRLARKLAPVWGWLPRAARACAAAVVEQRPEAVLTSGPPQQVHWLGYWLKRRYGLPWLADFRDPWTPGDRAGRGRDLASRRVAAQERLLMRTADAVIANASGASRALAAAYPRHRGKVVTLPNGYDRETFAGLAAHAPARRPPGATVRLVHAGAIYLGRDPRPVLDAVKILSLDSPLGKRVSLEVDFFGPAPESGIDLAGEARTRGLGDRVRVGGQVPYARAIREMVDADVLLLMDSPGRTVGVPAKLYEYIGARRPVLALGERGGDLEWVLARSGLPYRIAPPGDPSAIAGALADLAAVDPFSTTGNDPHQFSREAITGRLAALLTRCAGRPAGQGAEPDDPSDEASTLVVTVTEAEAAR